MLKRDMIKTIQTAECEAWQSLKRARKIQRELKYEGREEKHINEMCDNRRERWHAINELMSKMKINEIYEES